MKSIKIVHVLHSFDIGGLENGVVNLINHLDWQTYSHVICCITRSGRSAERLRRNDVNIVELEKPEGNNWSLPLRLAQLFKKIKPHIVHTRNWGTIDGIIGARLSQVPAVIHGEHGRNISEVEGNYHKRTFARWVLAPFVDCFITVSRALRDWLQNTVGINKHKIATICNGVDLMKFKGAHNKQALRTEYDFGEKEFWIGTVGRLDPIKDQACLIRALHSLAPQYPYVKLLVVGSGPCAEQLENLAKELCLSDRVRLVGERDDVPQLLRSMDVFVLPSLSEGISNTILEAMAMGLPVIATRVGGNIELIRDGETGLLIPSQNVAALVKAIQVYLKQPSKVYQHGLSGRRLVEQQFSLDSMIKAYHNLYLTLVRRKQPVVFLSTP